MAKSYFEELKENKIKQFNNGHLGSIIFAEEPFDAALFSEKELSVLQMVLDKFKDVKAGEISEISHSENAWIKNKDEHNIIDYDEAFSLKNI